ncbi:MAG: hypothetical protein LH615_00040, partial [Ferruginibacter sp.]|nr:hypothetical protein [Ferruginibacter sp.]
MYRPEKLICSVLLLLFVCSYSCKSKTTSRNKDVVEDPSEMNGQVKINIENIIASAEKNNYKLKDSSHLKYYAVLKNYYKKAGYEPVWCSQGKWLEPAELLIKFIDNAAVEGLYKEDYQFKKLQKIKFILDTDSIKTMNAVLWANADFLMSEAYAGLLKDLKQGRLLPDSLSWKNDTAKQRTFFAANFDRIKNGEHLHHILDAVQPKHIGYINLKKVLKKFTDSMDTHTYT